MTLVGEEALTNSVPAVAVIREERALLIMIGCKGFVDSIYRFYVKDKDNLFGSASYIMFTKNISKVNRILRIISGLIVNREGMSVAKAIN
jgi:hypothetical protein